MEMKKLLRSALIVAFLIPAAASAECMSSYYRAKDPACLDEIFENLRSMSAEQIRQKQSFAGFLAGVFSSSPELRDHVLKSESSFALNELEIQALILAGEKEMAKNFAASTGNTALYDKLATTPPLPALRPSTSPGDNDLLIGGYMASGDVRLIRNILENFSTADDSMAADAIRFGLLSSKFGAALAPAGREKRIAAALCDKYACKTDPAKLYRVVTLGTAYWALQSIGQQDERVKSAFTEFFDKTPRLKAILAQEKLGFANYLVAASLEAGLKQGASPYQQASLGTIEEALSKYESLGAASSVVEAMEKLASRKADSPFQAPAK